MADQAVRNGRGSSDSRQNNGVFEGVSSFGTDLATLAVLQARLAACDFQESAKAATPIVAGLIAFTLILSASVTIGLAGFGIWLATALNIQMGVVLMLVALVGVIVSAASSALLARSLLRCFTYFRRSQEELDRNLAWLRTTLVHSGR